MTMEEKLQLENFELETKLLVEEESRKAVELASFELETQLIEKGVLQ